MMFSKNRRKVKDEDGLFGWWRFIEPHTLLRKTDGATVVFLSEEERPSSLQRRLLFRTSIPGFGVFDLPVFVDAASRGKEFPLMWRAELLEAHIDNGMPLLQHPRCKISEWFLVDALSAWPKTAATGPKPGLIELRGGQVNNQVEEERWQLFHSNVSSDTRPRYPEHGLSAPRMEGWKWQCDATEVRLPEIPDFRELRPREILAWVERRLQDGPKLVCGERALFPLCRFYSSSIRWI